MRKWNRILSVLFLALMLCSCGKKAPAVVPTEAVTEAPDKVIVEVNGYQIFASDFEPYRQQYLSSYATDNIDEATAAYLEDAALTACIHDLLIGLDMQEQGCYQFDEETEAWIQEAGTAAYENALLEVGEYLRGTLNIDEDQDMTQAALAYAEGLGVTADNYMQVFRDQYASATYDAWLTRDCPVTDEDVTAAYEANVAADKERFGNDVAAFESALASGEAVWYQPEGYRSVLQILLPAQGDTEEAKLASVAEVLDTIYSRLDSGEAFEALIAEFGTDTNCQDEAFLSTGYSVHKDSIVWDDAFIAAAFGDDLSKPGTWSRTPVVSEKGVHILYYLKDAATGPAVLSAELRDALTYTIHESRVSERLAERLEELSAAAQVVFPE